MWAPKSVTSLPPKKWAAYTPDHLTLIMFTHERFIWGFDDDMNTWTNNHGYYYNDYLLLVSRLKARLNHTHHIIIANKVSLIIQQEERQRELIKYKNMYDEQSLTFNMRMIEITFWLAPEKKKSLYYVFVWRPQLPSVFIFFFAFSSPWSSNRQRNQDESSPFRKIALRSLRHSLLRMQ